MNNASIISAGINKLNEERQQAVESQARSIIISIEAELRTIKSYEDTNALDVADLKKLESSDLGYETVMGVAIPTTPGISQSTVIKTIEGMNKSRQDQVASKSRVFADNIAIRNKSIADCKKRIEEARKKLGELEVSEVTETQILG